MILLSTPIVIRHLICSKNYQNGLLNLNMIYERLWSEAGSGLLISILGKLNWFHLIGLATLLLLMWKCVSFLEETSYFKMLGLTFSSTLDRGSYIISIAKTAFKKNGMLICFMKFLSPEVTLYFHKSTIQPCIMYYCHIGAGAPRCYLELLDKLQKQICRTVGPSLAVSLEPLAHH